jgi:methylglutaconyl-CoA hydratase
MSESVLTIQSLDEATALVTLNRPARRNALTIELMQALCEALDSLSAQPGWRAAIVCGAGEAFCSGLDLHEAADANAAHESAEWVARTFEKVLKCPLVTIAAAHGAAYAGGGGLLACCDFAVASDDLRIAFPEVRRGLVPAMVAAVLRPRVRDGDLRELLLVGEPISAERGWEIGLIHHIVPRDDLLNAARSLAAQIARGGPAALRETKLLLRELHAIPAADGLQRALAVHQQARTSAEAEEGLAAFREHRDPQWPSP